MNVRDLIRICLIAIVTLLILIPKKDPWVRKAELETPERMASLQSARNVVAGWPPEVGKPFPNLSLIDHQGNPVGVESWRGKPTLVEIVAMSCAGCQGFSGGNKFGAFGGFAVQEGLKSIEEYYEQYTTGHKLHDPEINFVQIIIYNLHLEAPAPAELSAWRTHFHFDEHQNTSIISGGAPLASGTSFAMIPGFLLLDKDLTVRFDSTGHNPRHDLFWELLPGMKRLLAREQE